MSVLGSVNPGKLTGWFLSKMVASEEGNFQCPSVSFRACRICRGWGAPRGKLAARFPNEITIDFSPVSTCEFLRFYWAERNPKVMKLCVFLFAKWLWGPLWVSVAKANCFRTWNMKWAMNKRAPGRVGLYRGWHPTHLYRDCNITHYKDPESLWNYQYIPYHPCMVCLPTWKP